MSNHYRTVAPDQLVAGIQYRLDQVERFPISYCRHGAPVGAHCGSCGRKVWLSADAEAHIAEAYRLACAGRDQAETDGQTMAWAAMMTYLGGSIDEPLDMPALRKCAEILAELHDTSAAHMEREAR